MFSSKLRNSKNKKWEERPEGRVETIYRLSKPSGGFEWISV
jgi:hypothetical protein